MPNDGAPNPWMTLSTYGSEATSSAKRVGCGPPQQTVAPASFANLLATMASLMAWPVITETATTVSLSPRRSAKLSLPLWICSGVDQLGLVYVWLSMLLKEECPPRRPDLLGSVAAPVVPASFGPRLDVENVHDGLASISPSMEGDSSVGFGFEGRGPFVQRRKFEIWTQRRRCTRG